MSGRGSETLALVRCAASRGSACTSGKRRAYLEEEEANLAALNIRREMNVTEGASTYVVALS